jgi:UDP-N-acetylmuramate dehydrogenase
VKQQVITENISLRQFNTFRIDVKTKFFTEINHLPQLQQLITDPVFKDNNCLILGGGSNILFTRHFDGLIIKNNLRGIDIISEDEEFVFIKAAGGESWHQLVLYCVKRNLGGIENLSLIPGSVGAAPIQNIGAYGVELKDTFEYLEALNFETGNIETFTIQDCKFGYRNSIFKNKLKGKFFITSVFLKLNKHPVLNTSYGAIQQTLDKMNIKELTVKAVSDAVIHIRKSKLPNPNEIGNAGSFFKNPEIEKSDFENLKQSFPEMPGYPSNEKIKIPAGWLIEQCGWKGKRIGNTGAHKDQALVLVNYGNATGKEIIDLAEEIQKSVKVKFNITIDPEVNII